MYTDPLSDLLTRIRNALRAHHEIARVPHSKMKENILKIMQEKNFIESYEVKTEKNHKTIEITMKEGLSELSLKKISKPGQRIYIKSKDLKNIKSGLGIQILSTSKGLMTNMEARKQNIGGELICELY